MITLKMLELISLQLFVMETKLTYHSFANLVQYNLGKLLMASFYCMILCTL